MKKVLYVSLGQSFGGIEMLELHYAKKLSNRFEIDLVSPNEDLFEEYKKDSIKQNWNSYSLNIERKSRKNKLIYDYRLFKFLRKNRYDIVHINTEIFFCSFRVALISKLCGVKKVIAHSHGIDKTSKIKKFFIMILNPIYRSFIDEYLTCSMIAAESLFTKRFINKGKIKLLKNGIEIDKFKFNERVRNEYRKELDLEEKVVYGHVGRFFPEKNHKLLIDLFYEIQKKQENSILILVGDGILKKEIQEKVSKLNISDKVIFLGFRDDVNNILNAMDIFIMPSLREGLCISAVEAQTNGLLVFCSTNIPIESKISEKIKFFDLNKNIKCIANEICEEKIYLNSSREEAYQNAIEAGYDIKDVCKKLEKIYLK